MASKFENSLRIDGTLGRDAEIQHTSGRKCVVKFSICYNTGKKNQAGGWDKVPHWFDCQYWHDSPDDRRLVKGALVKVIGSLRQEKWTDQVTSQQRSKLVIKVESIEYLDKEAIFGPRSENQASRAETFDDGFEDTIPF